MQFTAQISTRRPLLVITPYGTSLSDIMNVLTESLRRVGTSFEIYTNDTEKIYNYGVVFMTDIMDNIIYTPNIIPIYIIEWGVRQHKIDRYTQLLGIEPDILYPTFIVERLPPNINIRP